MPLDPSIILGIKPAQIPSPEEYEAKSLTLQKLRQEGETGQLGLETARQKVRDDAATRQAFSQGGTTSEILQRLQMTNPTAAMAYQKHIDESQGRQATISKDTATAEKTKLETTLNQVAHASSILATVKDQPSYDAARRNIGLTFGPQAVANWPEQYDPTDVQQRIAQGMQVKDHLEQRHKDATLAQTTANDPFRAGPGGVPVAQPEVQAFQTGKARAGAAKTNIINQTGGSLAHQVGPMMKDSTEAAQAAVQQVTAAQQIVRAVDSGRIITGPLADKRLVLARVGQAIGVGGATEAERIANTQTAIRNLAQLTLQGRQQMRGQGAITVSEGELAQRAVSGDIDLSAAEIRALANAAERAGRFMHGEHTRKLNAMRQNPQLQEVVPFYEGPAMPPPMTAPGVNPSTLSDTELRRELNNPRPR